MTPRSRPITANRAAIYVRMSTELQQYSVDSQTAAVEKYASGQNITIVKRFIDYGKSGLTLTHRDALRDLLTEVVSGKAEFGKILVYDVSRWGRFQDADESAYYEYSCKRAGVQVHYCAEPFENDGSFYSTLVKTLKRSMAGEYSRELSTKVFMGQARLVELGFRLGGPPGYGLRRQLLNRDRSPKEIMKPGDRKSLQTDRVILVPGPSKEVSTVRLIFKLFTVQRIAQGQIVTILNASSRRPAVGRLWTRCIVNEILTNPKYVGAAVYNRKSTKLQQKAVRNPPQKWVRLDGAYKAIVPQEQYQLAQKIKQWNSEYPSDEDLLDSLRDLLKRVGKLSAMIIGADRATPAYTTYRKRFGSVIHAYDRIGYTARRSYKGVPYGPRLKAKVRAEAGGPQRPTDSVKDIAQAH